jgi:hypothetical protein
MNAGHGQLNLPLECYDNVLSLIQKGHVRNARHTDVAPQQEHLPASERRTDH